jgi:outer membrane receptor protein involved in Fe transport
MTRFENKRVSAAVKAKAALMLGALLSPALANSAVLEEIIVTAQKRAESLQDVPISVAAVGGEKIQDNFVMSLEGVSSYMPNVTIADSTAAEQLFIRGIGSGANEGFEQSVGTYVDGVYYGRGRSIKTGFLDMARVEVLKGPQGVLFGKNTIAGAINISTQNPTDEFEARVSVAYEYEHEEEILEGMISGPITDTLTARLAVRSTENDGWMENTFLNRTNGDSKELAARLTTVWDATDNLEVITKIQYTDLELGDRAAQLTECSAATQAAVAGIDDCRFDDKTTMSLNSVSGENHGFEYYDSLSVGITANWSLGEYTLTSVTGYTELSDKQALELDFTHLDALSADPRIEEFESLSQEIRITSPVGETFEYIAGLYYETSDLYRKNTFNLSSLARVGENWQDGESVAVFGSVDWNISESLTLTVGGRFTEDKKDLHKVMYFSATKDGPVLPITTIPGLGTVHDANFDRKDTEFSPTITLEWNPSDNHMYYVNYSEGFKSGGYDMASGSSVNSEIEFQPETAKSFEIGTKATLLDGAMELNLAVFHSEFSDLQVSTFDGNFSLLVGNAAEAIAKGVEVDMRWALTDELTLNVAAAYLNAEYDSYEAAQCTAAQTAATAAGAVCIQDMSGEKLTFAPERAANLGLVYSRDISDSLNLRLSTDINYTSEYWVAGDADPNVLEDGFTKVNALLAIASIDETWKVSVVAKNLTNEKTSHWGNDVPAAPGSYYKYLDRTRNVTLSAEYNF